MKRSPLSKFGKFPSTQAKRRIQALLRELAIQRDGGCVLRIFPEAGPCGPRRSDGQLILQADHLVSRARSVSFGDMRNIVCLCRNHHIYFKQRHGRLYWDLIQKAIGPERWEWISRVERDQKAYPMSLADWLKIEMALKQELAMQSLQAAA
ncbi:MAG TPA: hypothetical protein VOA88_15775 [Candidatus Dormibacteraeota bacterium]|nr:hypothetical protein [Candidatus Dormibacteraeota bacterium]